MYCKICGNEDIAINLLGLNICHECVNDINKISICDDKYDQYKNYIRIFFGYYISDKHQLNPVN